MKFKNLYMKAQLYLIVLVLLSGMAFSCNDFLDKAPDNRTEMNSEEKVRLLLVSAYSEGLSNYIAEMYSDNTDESDGPGWSYEIEQREMYLRQNVTTNEQDNPSGIWETTYKAIAAANLALETIESLGSPESLNPQKGEALLCRAYGHFCLVNLFSMAYGTNSGTDLGIPYATASETTVKPEYSRETVGITFQKINDDIEAGLPLIDDNAYLVPKYHFNKKAAYAFATRFNLYYQKWDKVVEYASVVLGSNPAAMLRDWAYAGSLSDNRDIKPNVFISETNRATLMLQSTYSTWPYYHGPYTLGTKYGHNETISEQETLGSNTPWGKLNATTFRYGTYSNPEVNRVVMRKYAGYFEYTDPVAQIGFVHMIHPAFTTDETLLCRAEAYAMLQDYDASLADLKIFMTAFTTFTTNVTQERINTFYEELDYYKPDAVTVKKRLNPDFTVLPGDQENFIHCVLHLRRILTIHEGLRLFDQKRYGITMYRRTLGSRGITATDSMLFNDPRRAIQLPSDVINAGLEANPSLIN